MIHGIREDGDCSSRRGSSDEDLAILACDSGNNILSAAYVTYTVYISDFTYCLDLLKLLQPSMVIYIFTMQCYDSLLECTYQGLIYRPTMSTLAYRVYIDFSHFPDVARVM